MLTGGGNEDPKGMYLVDTHNGAALNLNLSAIGVFQLFAKVIGRKVAAILSLTKLLQSLPYKFWQPFKVCTAQPTTPCQLDMDNFGPWDAASTSRLLGFWTSKLSAHSRQTFVICLPSCQLSSLIFRHLPLSSI